MKKFTFILLLLSFSLSGCFSKKEEVKPIEKPVEEFVKYEKKTEKKKPEVNTGSLYDWSGTYQFSQDNAFYELIISNNTDTGFDFHVSALEERSKGVIKGSATTEGNVAIFRDEATDCTLTFGFLEKGIKVITKGACHIYGDGLVDFNKMYLPVYVKTEEDKKSILNWTGNYVFEKENARYDLRVVENDSSFFSFDLTSTDNKDIGSVTGEAKGAFDKAVFIDEYVGCAFYFSLIDSAIEIKTEGSCDVYGGKHTDFNKTYKKSAL